MISIEGSKFGREKKMKKNSLRNVLHSINLIKLSKPAVLCISLLLIISMLSISVNSTVHASTTMGTFGNTSNSATDYSSVGTVTLSPYTMNNVNGQLSSVTMPLWMSST